MKFCQNCGNENEDHAKFCLNCGEEFKEEANESTTENNENVETVETLYYGEEKQNSLKKGNLGKVSMIVGIIGISLSVICCCCMMPIGLVLGPISLVLGIVSLVKNPNHQKGMAITGIVLGAIALLLGIAILAFEPTITEMMKEYVKAYCESAPDSEECQNFKQAFPDWFSE